ncbi:MAG: RimK-like ATP-grasp protein [Spirosoma sp.]|nr:RimK-like ATP-grasp protein [Spirosoma sp.]
MILILSDANDIHADFVASKIQISGLPYVRLNLDVSSLKQTTISYDGNTWDIGTPCNSFISDNISCVWMRRAYVELLLEEANNTETDFKIWRGEWNKTLTGLYTSLKQVQWLNFYRNAYKAENKYLQSEVARKLGFTLPATIVSNNKEKLLSFALVHGAVVMKLMNQEFYKTPDGSYKGLYVNKLNSEDLAFFGDSSENPIVLQKYIEKDFEVRYTVVGDEHFVCKIDSQKSSKAKVDWRRYDLPQTPHYPIEPPKDIRWKVAQLMSELKLNYGALDFIVSPDGTWVFLEINSMGQFLWIEDLTGLKISEGIVNWLQNVHIKYITT